MKDLTVWLVVGSVVAFVIFILIVQFLWNKLMPELFNIKQITFWQTFGLLILTHLLFNSCNNMYSMNY